jgi:hypothetical protein
MLRKTRPNHFVMWLPKWMRKARENEKDRLPPRDFALKEKERRYDAIQKEIKRLTYRARTSMDLHTQSMYILAGIAFLIVPLFIYHQEQNYITIQEKFGGGGDGQLALESGLSAEELADFVARSKDPNRIPWPVVHRDVTEMREGKRSLDNLQNLWEQTRYFYPGDWLIPVELTQVLKFNSALYLSQYVADPEVLRKEVLTQLLNVRYGRVASSAKVTQEVLEIIAAACDDLSRMSLADTKFVPLVPTNTA